MNRKRVTAAAATSSILGTYEGECADANITNLNGLDITRPVWEAVFDSDEYKRAIEMGWYIGFLGHPEDPNCMDFEHACIVMTDGYIDDDGKVYGKFNLIDTPVGRVVKAFQDAGVTFGISVRGAGDIIDNSVDPETFVFRGFDLVSFPAFPESIPTFTQVAASTDALQRKKYQKVCAAVSAELPKIKMGETLDILQSQFAKQSDEYNAIEAHKHEVCPDCDECSDEECADGITDLSDQKINAMTTLYLEAIEANKKLSRSVESLRRQLATTQSSCRRKVASIERIVSAQESDMRSEMSKKDEVIASLKSSNKRLVTSNSQLREYNLKYKQNIAASESRIRSQKDTISQLNSKLSETVTAAKNMKTGTSNLDAENRQLRKRVEACEKIIEGYQDSHARIFAHAIGADIDHLDVTAETTVEQLEKMISSSTSTANMSAAFTEPTPLELADDEDEYESYIHDIVST